MPSICPRCRLFCHFWKVSDDLQLFMDHNFSFRLSDVIQRVRDHYEKNPSAIYPKKFYNLLMKDLWSYEQDISVSRERSRVSWGIQTPSDPNQTIYVWLDALINYLTVAGYPDVQSARFQSTWPADCHLIGNGNYFVIVFSIFLVDLSSPVEFSGQTLLQLM